MHQERNLNMSEQIYMGSDVQSSNTDKDESTTKMVELTIAFYFERF